MASTHKTRTVVTYNGSWAANCKRIVEQVGGRLVDVTSREAAWSTRADAILLMGGTDINPAYYGQPRTYATGIDKQRDITEWALCRRAFKDNIPIMGICRGHQMLAVAAGGVLYQDLQHETGRNHPTYHQIDVVSDAIVDYIPEERRVNSYHHQAVMSAPPGFEVAATGPHGVIEAIYRPGALGVQWHPEVLAFMDTDWYNLFWWLTCGLD